MSIKEIAAMECLIVETLCHDPKWLNPREESILRWALSMARVTCVANKDGKDVTIGHATDRYRDSLFNTLKPFVHMDGSIDKKGLHHFIKPIAKLCEDERKDLLDFFSTTLDPESLDAAVRSRPLALVLGGGGGTGFVYAGAFEVLQRAGIAPAAIAGSSMGALLGAYRARYPKFSLAHLCEVMRPLSFEQVARPFQGVGPFTVPATFKLHLHEMFGREFASHGKDLLLSELVIPLRVCVAGIAHIEGEEDENLDEYAHLLDEGSKSLFRLRREQRSILTKLVSLTRKPLKPIYLGGDDLSRDFDVIDALGFSASVPGVFSYDVTPGDEVMREMTMAIMKRNGVYKLIDGGWADNMPAHAAVSAVQQTLRQGRDPFVLALDSFAPNYGRHILFLPLMQMAAQNSRVGRELAHRTITYRHVLSPLNIVPKSEELERAIEHGIAETQPHIAFIRKMVGPIEDPASAK